MEPRSTYTASQTLRAGLRAVQLAAWLEAMIAAHGASQPHGAAAWSWFLVRCVVFSLAAYIVVGIAAQIVRRRGTVRPGAPKPDEPSPDSAAEPFDVEAFESTASALLFHFGAPLWLWIFG